MDGISDTDACPGADQLFCAIGIGQGNGMDHRTELYEEFINLSRKIESLQSGVSIQYLLQDLCAGAGFQLG